MSVENSANNISQLNPNWPTPEDFVSEGDDHIRLLKKTVKQTFPNIKDSINISDVQLNALAKTVSTEDTGDKLVINGNLVVQKDGYGEIGKADFVLSELTDKTIVNIKMLRELTMPVGHIATLNVATNPKDLYGFGTWAVFGSGRVMLGVGTGTDSRNEAKAFTLGQTGGEYNHVLTSNELSAHTHGAGSLVTNSAGAHTHSGSGYVGSYMKRADGGGGEDVPAGGRALAVNSAGDHTHTITGNSASVGGNAAHNNQAPFIAVHMWVRTQ